MSFQAFVASVRDVAGEVDLRLPMAKLNDAISIAHYNKHYSQCVAAERDGRLPTLPASPPFLALASERYRVEAARLERAIRLALDRHGPRSGRDTLASGTDGDWRIPLALNSNHLQQEALRVQAVGSVYVAVLPSRNVQVDGSEVLRWGNVDDRNRASRACTQLAICRGADGMVLVRWWAETPDDDVLSDAIASGVKLMSPVGAQSVIGTSVQLARSRPMRLVLDRLGQTTTTGLPGAKSFAARIRHADAYPRQVAFSMSGHAEGPPTLTELHSVSERAPGWLIASWEAPVGSPNRRTPDWIVHADSIIERLRGRDLKKGSERRSRNPWATPQNTHAGVVDEGDPLDYVAASIRKREEYVYDFITLRLVKLFRDWQAGDAAQRLLAEQATVDWVVDGLLALHSERPELPMDQALHGVARAFGWEGVWKKLLYRWLGDAFARGVHVAAGHIRQYWIRIELETVAAENGPGIRALPDLDLLRTTLAGGAGGRHAFLDDSAVGSVNREFVKRHAAEYAVNAALLPLCDGFTRRYLGRMDRLPKSGVLAPTDGVRSDVWWYIAAVRGDAGALKPASQIDLGDWMRAANLRLRHWSAGVRIQSATVVAGNGAALSCG